MVEIVRGYVAAELEPLHAENKSLADANALLAERIAILEKRPMPNAIKGDPGEVDMAAVDALLAGKVAASISAAFEALPVPQDGKSIDMAEVKALVDEAVALIPCAADGADCDMDAVEAMLDAKIAAVVAAFPPAEKGDPGEVDMAEVRRVIAEEVVVAVSTLPPPQKGEDGKDGLSLANAIIDREGCLIVTFSDGRDKNLGCVVGKHGEDGADGETFTLDDFDIVPIDERSIKLMFTRGDICHSFELEFPVPVYRGVFRDGEEYARGDMVTWAGSLWHADKSTSEKPDAPDGGWRLAVKRGRDGRDAK